MTCTQRLPKRMTAARSAQATCVMGVLQGRARGSPCVRVAGEAAAVPSQPAYLTAAADLRTDGVRESAGIADAAKDDDGDLLLGAPVAELIAPAGRAKHAREKAAVRIAAMREKIKADGHASRYRLRTQLPEPVFGQIKRGALVSSCCAASRRSPPKGVSPVFAQGWTLPEAASQPDEPANPASNGPRFAPALQISVAPS